MKLSRIWVRFRSKSGLRKIISSLDTNAEQYICAFWSHLVRPRERYQACSSSAAEDDVTKVVEPPDVGPVSRTTNLCLVSGCPPNRQSGF